MNFVNAILSDNNISVDEKMVLISLRSFEDRCEEVIYRSYDDFMVVMNTRRRAKVSKTLNSLKAKEYILVEKGLGKKAGYSIINEILIAAFNKDLSNCDDISSENGTSSSSKSGTSSSSKSGTNSSSESGTSSSSENGTYEVHEIGVDIGDKVSYINHSQEYDNQEEKDKYDYNNAYKTSNINKNIDKYINNNNINNKYINNNIKNYRDDNKSCYRGSNESYEENKVQCCDNRINNSYDKGSNEGNGVYSQLLSLWNDKNINNINILNKKIIGVMDRAISLYGVEGVKKSISNYSEVYYSDFFYDHKWSMMSFLSRENGIGRFCDSGDLWLKYKKKQSGAYGTIMDLGINIEDYIDGGDLGNSYDNGNNNGGSLDSCYYDPGNEGYEDRASDYGNQCRRIG